VAPLAGVRVLDLSRILAGPYCSMMLADLGADVVKVERPGGGDPTRSWGPPFVEGESTYFLSTNRGKRSICVDLADPEGIELVRTLAAQADVVLENFIPGGAERMGLGYAALRERRPSLVYCSIAGYPEDGPDASRPGFDFAIQGEGGVMSITGDPDGDPMKVGVAIADITAGIYATVGVLAALREASASGVGSHVQVSLFDAQLAWLANRASDFLVAGETPVRLGNAHPAIVPYESFRASDGYVIVAIGTDAQFERFCIEASLPELLDDPRFATNPDRVRNRAELTPVLAAAIERRPLAEWLALMERAGVPGGPVRTIPEVFEHAPFATHTHEHATLGPIRTVRSPIGLDGTRTTADAPPPLLGEHAAEILAEAGYSAPEVERMLASICRTVI
jgi:crotonobetainyl-CoA:carnitine CoA-transferase CaiB-like acyl-CoA transferase